MKNFMYLLIFLLLAIVPESICADQEFIDKIEKKLKNTGQDTMRVYLLNDLSWEYEGY